MKNLLWLLYVWEHLRCWNSTEGIHFELKLMNSLFQVATRRSLPALQMATQIRHVATNAAEIFSILKNRN